MEEKKKLEELKYQSGFGNHFSSEAISGALPLDQNSPLLCPYGLYAEQISGTSFTSPRKLNQRRYIITSIFSFVELIFIFLIDSNGFHLVQLVVSDQAIGYT